MVKFTNPLLWLSLLLLLDFSAHSWVGVTFYSDKTLVNADYQSMYTTQDKIERSRLAASAFGISSPILVGQNAIDAEKLRQQEELARQQIRQEQLTKSNDVREIKAGDYQLKLLGIAFDGEKSVAIVEAAKQNSSTSILELALSDELFGAFRVSQVMSSYVVLEPMIEEKVTSDFREVRLHIYNPIIKKEIL